MVQVWHLHRETLWEEIASAVTHGLGVALAIAGLVVLVALASIHGTALDVVSVAVYGATLVLLYAVSTIYHSIPWPRAKMVWRLIDHAAIFLLIAGTYTPFALIGLGGAWGWALFGIVWGLAVAGVVNRFIFRAHGGLVTAAFSLVLGWIGVPAFLLIEGAGLPWVVVGGIIYSTGVAFFAWQRLPFNHAVWHLFVLVGSACHWIAVAFYLVPQA